MSKQKLKVYVVYSFGCVDCDQRPRIIKVCASKKIAEGVLNKRIAVFGERDTIAILEFSIAGVDYIHKGSSVDVIKVYRG